MITWRTAGGALLVLVAFWIFWPRTPDYTVLPLEGALVHLPFEGRFENLGKARVSGAIHDGEAEYARGPTGLALAAQGDGSWAEFEAEALGPFTGPVEVSFDVMPEDWTNPYEKGAATKTVLVLSGTSGERIRHLVFNISTGDSPVLSVAIEDRNGSKMRLVSPGGRLTFDWHSVRLRIDPATERTTLFLDDGQIGAARIVPSGIADGIDRIRVGTWHKANQAFRGLVDNVVIREIAD